MQHYTTAPPSASPGLDLFAAAWLERFTAHGGSVTVHGEGRLSFFSPSSPHDAPSYEPPPANWTDEQKERRRELDHWTFLGRQRELEELLDIVPGGREAVMAHVLAFPSLAYEGGAKAYL